MYAAMSSTICAETIFTNSVLFYINGENFRAYSV